MITCGLDQVMYSKIYACMQEGVPQEVHDFDQNRFRVTEECEQM